MTSAAFEPVWHHKPIRTLATNRIQYRYRIATRTFYSLVIIYSKYPLDQRKKLTLQNWYPDKTLRSSFKWHNQVLRYDQKRWISLTFSKLWLTPYNNSGMNDCAVWERGSPHTTHMPYICIMTYSDLHIVKTISSLQIGSTTRMKVTVWVEPTWWAATVFVPIAVAKYVMRE